MTDRSDTSKAHEMLRGLQGAAVPNVQPWDEAIGVYLDDGTKLFAMHSDGTVFVNDGRGPDVLAEAAVIFFRNVVEIARLQGFTVRTPSSPEGWDT